MSNGGEQIGEGPFALLSFATAGDGGGQGSPMNSQRSALSAAASRPVRHWEKGEGAESARPATSRQQFEIGPDGLQSKVRRPSLVRKRGPALGVGPLLSSERMRVVLPGRPRQSAISWHS